MYQIPKKSIVFAHAFISVSPSWQGGHAGAAHIILDRKQRKGNTGKGQSNIWYLRKHSY
jgi:hypothetical protein